MVGRDLDSDVQIYIESAVFAICVTADIML